MSMDFEEVMPGQHRFGAIITRLRLAKGWTKAKLAQRSGMHVTYIGTVERGGNVPSLATILELADVLGADVGAIMREVAEGRKKKQPA